MRLSVIVPTLMRGSLVRALNSIPVSDEVEIVLCVDYPTCPICRFDVLAVNKNKVSDFGLTARNVGLGLATGDWIAFLDDDDYWNPGALEAILCYCKNATIPAIFKMDFPIIPNGGFLWQEKEMKVGGFGLTQCVVPNHKDLPRFGSRYAADFDWMQEVVNGQFGGQVSWQEFHILTCPMQHRGI